jgi:hypothetical protein
MTGDPSKTGTITRIRINVLKKKELFKRNANCTILLALFQLCVYFAMINTKYAFFVTNNRRTMLEFAVINNIQLIIHFATNARVLRSI